MNKLWSSSEITAAERYAAERGWAIRADQHRPELGQYYLLTVWGFEPVSYLDSKWWVRLNSGNGAMRYYCGPETLLFNAEAVQELERQHSA